MTFLDFFAGIGGFRRGMELAGHKCVGFCEWDKFATASYISMHLITDEQRAYLSTLDLKQRQKEILKDEYRNGEWYSDDIRTVNAWDIPKADCWCFGFPCQDISIAGKQLGFTGNRSSLFFRVMYLLNQLKEEERPSYLFIENVKNLLSINGGWDFARLLSEMDEGGYDAEWCVLNSKDFGVPQNRERCFIIGHLRGRSRRNVFPLGSHCTKTTFIQGCEDRNRVIPQAINAGKYETVKPEPTDISHTLLSRDYKGPNNRGCTVVMYETNPDSGK
jgi:DNA (cytosine-5)-methyltransferase 1